MKRGDNSTKRNGRAASAVIFMEKWGRFELLSKCEANTVDKGPFLKGLIGDQSRLASQALQFPYVRRFADAAAAQTGVTRSDQPQSGPPANALRLGSPTKNHAPPSAPLLLADPHELVARALTILAEEEQAWLAQRGINPAPGSVR
jgi:hypothetical protein